jgi:hypothetical protein
MDMQQNTQGKLTLFYIRSLNLFLHIYLKISNLSVVFHE